MAQVTHGLRAILSKPLVYSAFQSLMGAHKSRQRYVRERIRPFPAMKILDIGCGPADILAYLPDVEYWGFDISAEYIARAQGRFGDRGRFECKLLEHSDLARLPAFDLVMAQGVLHHLDDPVAQSVIELGRAALRQGGRMLTMDPCIDPGQNPFARFLIGLDRGQNVRTRAAYAALAEQVFGEVVVEVRHTTWIPYTHCHMECTRR